MATSRFTSTPGGTSLHSKSGTLTCRRRLSLSRDERLMWVAEPGRVALHLQKSGIEVVGIDHSPLAVQTCRERGLSDVRVMPVTQVSSNRLGVFDSITMIGNNFGLVGNPKRARRLLRRLCRMTTGHGRILVESTDPYATDDPLDLAYQKRNRQQGRMSGQYRHRELYRNLKGPWYDWLFVSRDEMREVVAGTGWVVRKFIEPDGAQYVAVLEKDRDA